MPTLIPMNDTWAEELETKRTMDHVWDKTDHVLGQNGPGFKT